MGSVLVSIYICMYVYVYGPDNKQNHYGTGEECESECESECEVNSVQVNPLTIGFFSKFEQY